MGDRSQVCIKDGKSKVYLYGHWAGADIYKSAARAIKDVPGRLENHEYFTRAVFCRMIPAGELLEETGYGIGTSEHEDIEHPILVLDCETGTASFTNAKWDHNKRAPLPGPMPFAEFADRAVKGDFDKF